MTDSKLEERLSEQSPEKKPLPGQPDLRTAIEKELDAEDSQIAKELQRTRAQQIIAERKRRISQLTGEGERGPEEKPGGRGEKSREWLVDVAQGLLERGLEPAIVGRMIDYLLGIGQSPAIGLPGAPAPNQGMTFNDVKEIFTLGKESSKTDPAIATILEKVTDKLSALEQKVANPNTGQKGFIVVKSDGTYQEFEPGKPVIIEPPAPVVGGESLEVIKEKNRHAEEVERLKTERDYKVGMVDAVGNLAEDVGAGAARQTLQHKEVPGKMTGGGVLETFQCPECKTTMYVTPETTVVKCQKCGNHWQRPGSAPPAPPGPPPPNETKE
jgi:ribosomal protein S27E